jgi:hypothetical protein
VRVVPYGSKEVVALAATAAAPLLHLSLTMMNLRDLIKTVVKLVF